MLYEGLIQLLDLQTGMIRTYTDDFRICIHYKDDFLPTKFVVLYGSDHIQCHNTITTKVVSFSNH